LLFRDLESEFSTKDQGDRFRATPGPVAAAAFSLSPFPDLLEALGQSRSSHRDVLDNALTMVFVLRYRLDELR
jgi:hypothetical protein